MTRNALLALAAILLIAALIWAALTLTGLAPHSGGPADLTIIAAALTGLRFLPTPRKAHTS